MRHVSLTCINHPALRWQCKSVAVNAIGQYNGARHIFFLGTVDSPTVAECTCPPSDLRFSPEELAHREQMTAAGRDPDEE